MCFQGGFIVTFKFYFTINYVFVVIDKFIGIMTSKQEGQISLLHFTIVKDCSLGFDKVILAQFRPIQQQ